MIRAAIIGLGTWGQNLVLSVQGVSPSIRFTSAATRSPDKAREFAQAQGLRMLPSYEAALADPDQAEAEATAVDCWLVWSAVAAKV